MEKAVDLMLRRQIIFGIEDGIDNAVFTENPAVYLKLRCYPFHVLFCFVMIARAKQRLDDSQMIVHIVADLPNRRLVLFQLFIIAFLQLQIFSLHILPDTDNKIFCKGDTSKVGGKACECGRPHLVGLARRKIDTGGDTHQGSQTDSSQQYPDLVIEQLSCLSKVLYKKSRC